MASGIEFDPGFGEHIMAFQGTVEYLYTDINRFKNFSQRKLKFKQYYKKILEVFNNNLGFYTGCLMWAAYIKTLKEQNILNNNCLGQDYNEEENIASTEFMLKFTELFPKDMKYFMGETFEFDESVKLLLDTYKDFLVINKGFVNSKKNTDIKLPQNINTLKAKDYKKNIDESIKLGDLSKLVDNIKTLLDKA